MKFRKSIPALLLAFSGIIGALAGAGSANAAGPLSAASLAPESTYAAPKSMSGALAQTDPALLGRTDSTPVNVLIKYDFDATASYGGGVAGLAPTSPSVTGKKLKNNKNAVQAYEKYATDVSNKISSSVKAALPNAKIGQAFTTAYGGVAAKVPRTPSATCSRSPGSRPSRSTVSKQPQTSVTPQFTGAANVWPSLGGQDNAASGIVVGVIDTGIWPEHPSFANVGLPPPPGGPYACQFGDGSDVAHLGPTFACNCKLVGAYAKTATYMANVGAGADEFCNNTTGICSARDPEGHGTHTASTAAGNRVDSAVLYGVQRGPISGMAPGARVIMYRVCLAGGCFGSDSVAAVQQAIVDEVDVINFSISGGGNAYADAVELAFLDAFRAGISVNASAGNAGPGSATADHGGPWVTTVGASTSNRFFTTTLHLTADGGATFDIQGVTITNGISTATPVILAQSIPGEDALCQTKLDDSRADRRRNRQDRHVPARRECPCRQGLQCGLGRRCGDDPVQRGQAGRRDRQSLAAGGAPRWPVDGSARLCQHPHEREGDVGAGHAVADARRRDGGILLARAAGRFHQAGHHRPGDPGARGNDAPANGQCERPARQPLPGDRGHLDVEPACGGALGARQGRASPLDAGDDQVRADDIGRPGRRQGGRRNAGDAVRRRLRFGPRRPRGQPDARLRRNLRRLRRVRGHSVVPDRPQYRQRGRADDDRPDHDQADGDQRQRQGPGPRDFGRKPRPG